MSFNITIRVTYDTDTVPDDMRGRLYEIIHRAVEQGLLTDGSSEAVVDHWDLEVREVGLTSVHGTWPRTPTPCSICAGKEPDFVPGERLGEVEMLYPVKQLKISLLEDEEE